MGSPGVPVVVAGDALVISAAGAEAGIVYFVDNSGDLAASGTDGEMRFLKWVDLARESNLVGKIV